MKYRGLGTTCIFRGEYGGIWAQNNIHGIKMRNHAHVRCKLYPTRSDLHRDLIRPLASWDVACIIPGHDFLPNFSCETDQSPELDISEMPLTEVCEFRVIATFCPTLWRINAAWIWTP